MGLACPRLDIETVEVRLMMEITDFPVDVQKSLEQLEQQIAEDANQLGQQ